jgi:hypothetical protein
MCEWRESERKKEAKMSKMRTRLSERERESCPAGTALSGAVTVVLVDACPVGV